jgi:hypothetical protein
VRFKMVKDVHRGEPATRAVRVQSISRQMSRIQITTGK